MSPRFGRTRDDGAHSDVTLTVHDIMRLRGCSRATAYRILRDGAAAGTLTVATEYVTGGNGARQKRRVVRAEGV